MTQPLNPEYRRCRPKLGATGVTQRPNNGKWRAKLTVKRKRINLGDFPTEEEAKAAYAQPPVLATEKQLEASIQSVLNEALNQFSLYYLRANPAK